MSFLSSIKFVTSHPLNRGQPFRALYRVAKWQARSRLRSDPLIHQWIGGTKLAVHRGETALTGNLYCGLYEFSEMAYVLHTLGSDDCFVDVGANSGAYTLLASGVRGAQVICFEPIPSAFRRLIANIALNGITDRVVAHNSALGEAAGQLRFTSNLDCTNHALSSAEEAGDSVVVDVVSMDSALAATSPTVIKIDVEGFETCVLRGGNMTLTKPSLHSVIVELNGSGQRYGFSDETVITILNAKGFTEYDYVPFERELRSVVRPCSRAGNSIFIRDVGRVRSLISNAPRFEVNGRRV